MYVAYLVGSIYIILVLEWWNDSLWSLEMGWNFFIAATIEQNKWSCL